MSRKKHRAKRNPAGVYLVAKLRGRKYFFARGKLTTGERDAKIFGSASRARTKADELIRRFPMLKSAVFSAEEVSNKRPK